MAFPLVFIVQTNKATQTRGYELFDEQTWALAGGNIFVTM